MDGIVFISFFLGLISGTQWVEMRAAPEVKAVRLTFEGRELAMLTQPPWQTRAEFGDAVVPGELVATGYDERGEEIARAVQMINLPRSVAEIQIVPQGGRYTPTSVRLVWHHREAAQPKRADVWFEGTQLRVEKDFSAKLPPFDAEHSHVVTAEMRFRDGAVARADVVIHGGFSDAMGAQLTPIALVRTAPGNSSLEGCLTLKGNPVRISADESIDAQVYVVRNPDRKEAKAVLDPFGIIDGRSAVAKAAKRESPLDPGTHVQIVWPVAERIVREGEPTTKLFFRTAVDGGMRWILNYPVKRKEEYPLEFAEAVAVAGLRGMSGGQRRAVVLLLSKDPDRSLRKPAVVRRYLESVGVPLFVWSLTGPRPDLAETWGEVQDISSREKLRDATDRVRAALATQRVVWVQADPLSALRVEVDPKCGVAALAK